jgi:predicted metal-dependent peptidase
MNTNTRPGDKLMRARVNLIRNDRAACERPHLLAMKRVETTQGTASTDGRTLTINVPWIEQFTQDEIIGVILHEVRHRMLKHNTRHVEAFQRAKSIYPHINNKTLAKAWNIAADLRVNTDLIDDGWCIPMKWKDKDGKEYQCVLDRRKEFVGWSTERIFFKLLSNADQGDPSPDNQGWGDANPLPEEGSGEGSGDKGDDSDGSGTTPVQSRREFEQEVDALNTEGLAMAKKRGVVPGSMASIIKQSAFRPDWTHRLANSISTVRGADEFSMARISNPGRRRRMVMPGTVSNTVGHVVIGIDTSGSISAKELSLYLSKINGIVRSENPERLTIIQCDARVQAVHELEQGEEVPSLVVKGRGGTAFQPVFDHIRKENWSPEFIIYMTDGVGDNPRDPGLPVIWVTTNRKPANFGIIIEVN